MNKMKIAFGIGMVLAVLAVFTASAAAQTVYFDPDPSSAGPGETITVTLWLDTTDGVASFNTWVHFDPGVVNITSGTAGDFPTMWGFVHFGDYVKIAGVSPDWLDQTGHLKLADLTLEAKSPGTSTLYYTNNGVYDQGGTPVSATWNDGTFTCTSPPETFSKPLLVGWNLISLPLTNTTNMTVANIIDTSLNGNYDALHKYDNSTHNFVPLTSSDTMENGVGYFIHMTAADTWTYTGSAYLSMNVGLSQGLNMAGWLNCSKAISDTSLNSSSNVSYIARWNATAQSYETHNPAAPNGFKDFFDMERGTGYFISAKEGYTALVKNC